MLFFASVILIVIGLAMAIFPAQMYELRESLRTSAVGEPADWYLKFLRIVGIFCTVLGIVALVIFFVYGVQ